jgi:branched-chain amino acid aminotransferase
MRPEYVFFYDKKGPRIVPREDARMSVYDHGGLYGDGVFEGIRIYNERIFKFKEHVDRLFASAEAIELKIPLTKEELSDYIVEVCEKNGLKETGYIRLVVTRGEGDLGLNPEKCPVPTIFAIAQHIQMYSEGSYENGLEVLVSKTHRTSARSLSPNVKSLNYLNNIMAKIEATKAGCEEAIMRDMDGRIAECTGDNFFMVHNNMIYTPTDRAALKGITRGIVKEICRREKIEFYETDITLEDLYLKASELFLTGTAAEIVPVVKVKNTYLPDGARGCLTIGNGKPGPIAKKILELYRKETLKPENGTAIYDVSNMSAMRQSRLPPSFPPEDEKQPSLDKKLDTIKV